ncbi:hypothetical protein [Companilactobacillus farciminis]|uniref:hypothetical protein n=1 Tax=Companilactobacillus farciminis TaxID=1612 RepID=UPI001915AAA5|nr:hypothetical protein [Companilactobacillus farciminis]
MQQVKEPIRLLPEQKTFLLSRNNYKQDSLENFNNTLVIASDTMSRCYSEIFKIITQLTNLDEECSLYEGNILTNQDLIIAAKALNRVQDRLDQKLIKANPYVLQIEKHKNRDRR